MSEILVFVKLFLTIVAMPATLAAVSVLVVAGMFNKHLVIVNSWLAMAITCIFWFLCFGTTVALPLARAGYTDIGTDLWGILVRMLIYGLVFHFVFKLVKNGVVKDGTIKMGSDGNEC